MFLFSSGILKQQMHTGAKQQQNNRRVTSFPCKSGRQTPNRLTSAPVPRLDSHRKLYLVRKSVGLL